MSEIDEHYLSSADAIMDPQIFTRLRSYVQNGGKPESAITMLSANYRGYAEMTNLLSSWLVKSGKKKETVDQMVIDHLQELILKEFDPEKADSIFKQSSSTPTWLDFMISRPEWRTLIYKLSEKNKNCLMINFAIQKISEAGHQDEIASVTSASTFFRVFHRVLTDAIFHATNQTQEQFSASIGDLKKLCSHSQYTYLYAQTLLKSLSQLPNGKPFQRLFEELELHTATQQNPDLVRRMTFLLNDTNNFTDLTSAISSILNDKTASPGDIIKLDRLYSSDRPPPAEFLRHPELLGIIVRDLFSANQNINISYQRHYVYILSYAASVVDSDSSEKQKSYLKETMQAINSVLKLIGQQSFIVSIPSVVSDLVPHVQHPVVSMGVMQWVKFRFTNAQYTVSSYNLQNFNTFLNLLKYLAILHPLQRESIIELLSELFYFRTELESLQVVEVRRGYLDMLLFLMQIGFVFPAINLFHQWVPDLDQSLIRHFVSRLVNIAEPPYSIDFVKRCLKILEEIRVKDALKTSKTLKNFVNHIIEQKEKYELSEEDENLLSSFKG